jgi:zinc transporter ZupT
MRTPVVLVLVTLLGARPALAQSSQGSDSSHKVVKIIVGAGMLAVGTAVAAKSSKTTTFSQAGLPPQETSEFSKSQLVTGLVIIGVGGIVLWDGLRDHGRNSPSTVVGVALSKRNGSGVFVRRSW